MAGRLKIAALCLWCTSCGEHRPAINVEGVWEAQPSYSHSAYYYLVLAQDGNDIRGTACHFDNGPGIIFHDVPVSGAYPDVLFSVTLADISNQPYVQRFAGRVTSSGSIIGALSFSSGTTDLTFSHVDYALPAMCSTGNR